MPTSTNEASAPYAAARIALRVYLASRNETAATFARRIGMTPAQCSGALLAENQDFYSFRHRLRIEEALDRALWNDPLERFQLAYIGKRLGVKIFQEKVGAIRRAAIKRRVPGIADNAAERFGFSTFGQLLLHFFPSSPILALPRYTPTKL